MNEQNMTNILSRYRNQDVFKFLTYIGLREE